LRNKFVDPHIVAGSVAALGQLPWQAALYFSNGTDTWFCGGSVISKVWIVTAGHCVEGAQRGTAITGVVNISDHTTGNEIYEMILHEAFNSSTLENDIALIALTTPLKFDDNTKAVTLGTEHLDSNYRVTVSGWGTTHEEEVELSQVLRFVTMTVISNDICQEYYEGNAIFDGMFCAMTVLGVILGTCHGDSGGPAVINTDTNPVHVGIISFVSTMGCESGRPNGYTRTAHYRNWIKANSGV
jgi:secreted trypsin-like serine protease